jgi:hypothetical protein
MPQRAKDQRYYIRSKDYYRYAVVRMDHGQYAEVQEFAGKLGLSVAEALRTLVEWGLEAPHKAEWDKG